MLMDAIAVEAKNHESEFLSLNVNRKNPALGFYENLGFENAGEEDIVLDHGYLMEDYIMKKPLP